MPCNLTFTMTPCLQYPVRDLFDKLISFLLLLSSRACWFHWPPVCKPFAYFAFHSPTLFMILCFSFLSYAMWPHLPSVPVEEASSSTLSHNCHFHQTFFGVCFLPPPSCLNFRSPCLRLALSWISLWWIITVACRTSLFKYSAQVSEEHTYCN